MCRDRPADGKTRRIGCRSQASRISRVYRKFLVVCSGNKRRGEVPDFEAYIFRSVSNPCAHVQTKKPKQKVSNDCKLATQFISAVGIGALGTTRESYEAKF